MYHKRVQLNNNNKSQKNVTFFSIHPLKLGKENECSGTSICIYKLVFQEEQ